MKMRLQLGDVVSSQVGAEGMGLVTLSGWKWGRQSVKKDWEGNSRKNTSIVSHWIRLGEEEE